ncbi:MAG: YbaB/EbfC family nucleoid-associated protein [Chlamydiales bacterium]
MGSGYAKKKKEAKRLQETFREMQEKLKGVEAKGSAGSGLVSLTLNGEHEITEIKILPECVDPEEVEALEDLIRAAHNDAVKKLESSSSLGLPPGLDEFIKF